jgi:hypothetical protein
VLSLHFNTVVLKMIKNNSSQVANACNPKQFKENTDGALFCIIVPI